MILTWLALVSAAVGALGCELTPGRKVAPKSPGDNYYKLLVNGEVERYAPGKRYIVTLVGSRTHEVVQKFTGFKLIAEPLDPATKKSVGKQGEFQLFADSLTRFDDECINSVVQSDDLPKTEIQVMWRAPPSGSGCVLLKAMVYENDRRWFAEDGQLTKRICEDTSIHASTCCACDDAKYKMVFEGLWSAQTHPKDFPTQALWLTHFSDVIGATHPNNFSFWGEGIIATDGFRSLAEWGSVGLLERELRQYGGLLRSIVKAQGLWYPKVNTNTSATFTVDRKRHLLSLASMFGPSPDWVVGVNGFNLCRKDCSWVESTVVDLFPYDAGTDDGISYLSPNLETVPREKMYKITTMYPEDPRAPFYNPNSKEIAPMARLYLTREKLISRSCDEEALQLLVAEEAENTESVDRPECAVSEWGAWSACSVTCGKGLRSRARTYRRPQSAQSAGCDRQLVAREMCVADVPECESDGSNDEANAFEVPGPVEDGSGICQTTPWGPWSECSVTCGIGVSTRRRQFVNHMGLKKCPLVQIEDNRKCMEPVCTEQEVETPVSDPTCPTSEWSGWSPCSASCGRGVKFRTRLLLVPADRQQECSAKVELLQQRPCQEIQDCNIDMMTAKRICMAEPEQGPCRGVYQRWAFSSLKGMCVPFNYGGCRGNRNNFITQQECFDTCKVVLGGNAAAPGAANAVASSSAIGQSADCQVSAWTQWSRCSVSCGQGFQERTRSIVVQPGPDGAACPPRLLMRRRCNRYCA